MTDVEYWILMGKWSNVKDNGYALGIRYEDKNNELAFWWITGASGTMKDTELEKYYNKIMKFNPEEMEEM